MNPVLLTTSQLGTRVQLIIVTVRLQTNGKDVQPDQASVLLTVVMLGGVSLIVQTPFRDGRPAGFCLVLTLQVRMNKNTLLNLN